jgi:hypothetical protein
MDTVEIKLEQGTHYLLFEEIRPHGDLVLFNATCITRTFGRHIVLATSRPIFIILQVIRDILGKHNTSIRMTHLNKLRDQFTCFFDFFDIG